MGRRRYIENPTGAAAQKRIMEQLPDTLVEQGRLRMQLMFPPPLNPKQLMRMLYEPDEIAAMHLLVKRNLGEVMKTERSLTVCMDIKDGAGSFQVELPYPGPLPKALTRISAGRTYVGMHLDELIATPETLAMVQWMENLWAEREIIRHLKRKMRDIREQCGTLGQALRVWPDLHHVMLLMPQYREYQREAKEAKARSPIPLYFCEATDDPKAPRTLEHEWRPEELEKWGAYLASLHMLPEPPAGMVKFTMSL